MKKIILYLTIFFLLNIDLYSQFVSPMFTPGNAVLTDFSGTNGIYDPKEFVVSILNTKDAYPNAPKGSNWNGIQFYHHPTWIGEVLGQVFGITIDNSYNIYVSSTSVYGKFNYGIGGSGAIYKLDAQTGVSSVFTTLPNFLDKTENYYPGLGNICYDKKHNQFFATNFEDGKIYRIDYSGNILDSFDPFTVDNGLNGFAPLGERLWGIGIFNDTIYFSRFVEHVSKGKTGVNQNSVKHNEIWSVQLDVNGTFISKTSKLEITHQFFMLNNFNITNPISDIEFSQDGKRMLVAERTMIGDINIAMNSNAPPTEPIPAHNSLAYEYEKNNNGFGWKAASKFHVGAKTLPGGPIGGGASKSIENCAGGIDYSFFPNYNSSTNVTDSLIWITGDILTTNDLARNYGLQGTPRNEPFNTPTNSYIIDANGKQDIFDKGLIGDVDIFKPVITVKIDSCLEVLKSNLNFKDIICFGSDSDYVVLNNCGDADIQVTPSISSNQDFNIIPPFNIPFIVKKKDLIIMKVAFVPKSFGLKKALLTLKTNSKTPILNVTLNGLLIEKGDGLTQVKHDFGNVDLGKSIIFISKYFNKRNLDVKVQILHSPNVPFELIKPTSNINIKGNDSAQIVVKFLPYNCGYYNDSLILILTPCPDTIIYRFNGNGILTRPKLSDTLLDFQIKILPESQETTKSFRIINNTDFTITKNITLPKNPFKVVLANNPITILPKDSLIIDVTFNPKSAGDFLDSIKVSDIGLCQDTQYVKLIGKAILKNFVKCISINKIDILFNNINCIGEDEQSLIIKNCGDTILIIDCTIVDTNNIFSINSPYDKPFDLKPNDSIIIFIKFKPILFGKSISKLKIESNSSLNPIIYIPLYGDKLESKSFISLQSLKLNYGVQPITQKPIKKVWLLNKSNYPINLSQFYLKKQFEILSPKDKFIIPKKDSIQIEIMFIPQTCGVFSDTIIYISSPCPDTTSLIVTGEGETKFSSIVSIGTISDTIKSGFANTFEVQQLPIPIILRKSELLSNANANTFITNIKFSSKMLIPIGFTMVNSKNKGVILNQEIQNNSKNIKVKFELNELPTKDSIFAYLNVEAYYADSLNTSIEFDSTVSIGGCEITTLNSIGNYYIYPTPCVFNTNRLFYFVNAFKINSITPNPIKTEAVINLTLEPNTLYSLDCNDLSGKNVCKIIQNEISIESNRVVKFILNSLSNGVYQLVLKSNQGIVTKNINVTK